MAASDSTQGQGPGPDTRAGSGAAAGKVARSAALRVALIALASDHGIRGELGLLLGRRAELHLARVSAPDGYDLASLAATAQGIGRAIKWMGLATSVDVAAYGCTSATVVVGEEAVKGRLQAALPGVPGTTPITAALAALAHLGARRIALLTPYPEPIHRAVAEYLGSRGLAIVDQASLGISVDREITEYPAEGLRARILALDRRGAEAIFVSCTSLRIAGAIAKIEAASGLPLITSNQALAWHCLQLAGRRASLAGFGRLLAAGG
jgi:maleate isomerase